MSLRLASTVAKRALSQPLSGTLVHLAAIFLAHKTPRSCFGHWAEDLSAGSAQAQAVTAEGVLMHPQSAVCIRCNFVLQGCDARSCDLSLAADE
jgi:hypothetical protein